MKPLITSKRPSKKMKYHPHGSVLFVTFSLEEGILLLSNPLCDSIIKSCLARAQFMHPVKICAFHVEGNHIHMIIVVDCPDDVPGFMRYFKTESAHMLNRVLGRKKRTVWCESYDDPIVLSMPRALIALVYIYTNPAKDNLEDSIEKYPGVSSWKMLTRGEFKKTWNRLRRRDLEFLPPGARNLNGYTRAAKRLHALSVESHEFILSPNAWLEAFGITAKSDQELINQKLINRVFRLEERFRKKRARERKWVIGAKVLSNQAFDLTYQSARSGRRMWCLSESRSLRTAFIGFLKKLFLKARAVRARWEVGDFSVPYPAGLYPPMVPKLQEPLFIW